LEPTGPLLTDEDFVTMTWTWSPKLGEKKMTAYEVDFSYKLPEWGVINVDAENVELAEEQAMDIIKDLYQDIEDIKIEALREIS